MMNDLDYIIHVNPAAMSYWYSNGIRTTIKMFDGAEISAPGDIVNILDCGKLTRDAVIIINLETGKSECILQPKGIH